MIKKEYLVGDKVRIYCGDSRDLSEINDASVFLTVTSPPYFVGKEYERYLPDLDSYLEMLQAVWEQVYLKTMEGGRLVVNIAHTPKLDMPSILSVQLYQMGWNFNENIVWEKPSFNPRFGSFVQNCYSTYYLPNLIHEHILVFSKGHPKKVRETKLDLEWAKQWRNDIWFIKPETRDIGHEAPFPLELPETIILLYSSEKDTVLDPFIGSGTTALACMKNNRSCIGYEKDLKYFELTENRIKDELKRVENN